MNSKSKLKYLTVLCAFLAMLLLPCKVYAACHNVSCGCRANGIMSCAGATCWYTDSDGCSGHSWYLYDEYGATCTSGGSVEYHCSICPGRRITSSPPLGHDWGSWYCVNSSTHKRSCRRCGLEQYEGHNLSGWRAHGDGYYSRSCSACGYTQTKGIFVSASTYSWTADNVNITVRGYDGGVGNRYILLYRVNCITGVTTLVGNYQHGGTSGWTTDSYTQTDEGIYYYYAVSTDNDWHSIQGNTGRVYLDHSDPVIIGVENTNTEWTNVAPSIAVRSTDYLMGTVTAGSGLRSVKIYNDKENLVAAGSNQTSYTLRETDEGERTFVIEATDNVGHISRSSVTTRYDITSPGIDGTEITFVRDGIVVSGYMQDNIMDQHIDDEIVRSVHGANKSSGIKSVIVYKVTGTKEEVIYLDTTYHQFASPDTHSFFDVYYDINQTEDAVDYYLIITRDFAGNQTKKKLTSQRTLLTMFRTSIDRGAY